MNEEPKTKSDLHVLSFFLLLAALIRFSLSAVSYGTNDIDSWLRFARGISEFGLFELYNKDELFNHPPLVGLLNYSLYEASKFLELPFSYVFRMPAILADLFSVALIYKIARFTSGSIVVKALVATLGPIFILISAYHGNTDSIYTALVLLAAYLALSREDSSFWSGLVLGLACNVKIIPVLLGPAFFFHFMRRKLLLPFLFGLLIASLPFAALLLLGAEAALRNIFLYSSFGGYWGIQMFLLLSQGNNPAIAPYLEQLSTIYQQQGKFLVVGALFPLAYFAEKRSQNLMLTLAASMGFFAVFAPGFAIQYLVLPTALFLCVSTKWGIWTAIWSGAMAAGSYMSFLVSWDPIRSVHNATAAKPVIFLGFLAWLCMSLATFQVLRQIFSKFKRKRI